MSTESSSAGKVGRADLRRAIVIYMELAYADREPPEAVRRRLDWPDDLDIDTLLAQPPFERVSKAESSPIHALRLGNRFYPHMKVQIQAWPCPAGFLLSVNTHDQILGLDPTAPDAAAFRQLQGENQRLKETIEQAWDAAELPTFSRYLREYLASNPGPNGPAESA